MYARSRDQHPLAHIIVGGTHSGMDVGYLFANPSKIDLNWGCELITKGSNPAI
jgi:hypothetical protein